MNTGPVFDEYVEMVYGYCALLIFRKQLPLACASDDPFLDLANRIMHVGRTSVNVWQPFFSVGSPELEVWRG